MSTRHHHITHLFLIFSILVLLPTHTISAYEIQPKAHFVTQDQQILHNIQDLVHQVYDRDRRLMVGIDHVKVSTKDFLFEKEGVACESPSTLGALKGNTIYIKESGELNEHILYHESAHNRWRLLTNNQQHQWTVLHNQSNTFVTTYAKSNALEDFAETMACWYVDHKGCKARISQEKLAFITSITS